MGRHMCPGCHQKSQLPRTVSYYLWVLFGVCVSGAPVAWFFYKWRGSHWWIAGWLLGGLLVGIPFDKFLDAKLRPLEKIKTDQV